MFRRYIYSLMIDENNGLLDMAVKHLLFFLSLVYGIAIKVIDWAYRVGLRRQYRVNMPVVSVGNITLGGTGKTPFVIFLASYFLSKSKKPIVLTRGYGKDENKMLRGELPNVKVLVGQDRVKNAKKAKKMGGDIIILDDAYQHRRIARNINILLLDGVSLFGNGHLVPRGILREHVTSIRRADIFILTKTDRIDIDRKNSIIKFLKNATPEKPIIIAHHRPSFLSDVNDANFSTGIITGKKISLVSGIGDPEYFAFMVESLGASIVSRIDYPDHYSYKRKDITLIYARTMLAKAEKIIITRKDYVKIKDLDISNIEGKLLIMNIVMDVINGKEQLLARLDSLLLG